MEDKSWNTVNRTNSGHKITEALHKLSALFMWKKTVASVKSRAKLLTRIQSDHSRNVTSEVVVTDTKGILTQI